MTKKYLLPCSCGEKLSVEASQAGQTVVCSCGREQQIPSMQKIKVLPEAVQPKPETVRGETGALRRGYFYFGAILFLPASAFLIWASASAPKPRDVSLIPDEFTFGQTTVIQDSTPISQFEHQILWLREEQIDRMAPMDLYFLFQSLKQGPMFGMNWQEKYQSLVDAYRIRVAVAGILVGLSVLSVIVSFFLPKRNLEVLGWSGSDWR